MTPARRIFINVIASHGRSIFVLACSFLTSRWALKVLGNESYGLLGLIGGMAIIISILNTSLAISINRFFAYAIGEEATNKCESNSCQKWFNVALFLHFSVAAILVIIGYPLFVWIIRHYIEAPPEAINDCIKVFRWTLLSAWIGMVTVPFRAMYTAKQHIAELTIYSFIQTTIYTCALYYMVTHAGDWFVWVAIWLCFQNSFVNIAIALRALLIFPECKINPLYFFDKERITRLCNFSSWEFLGISSQAVRDQGLGFLVNKALGPSMNASYTIAWSLAGRTATFSNEIDVAFAPAISTAYGEGNRDFGQRLAFQCSKFGTAIIAIVALPLVIEMPKVLQIWLDVPPPQTTGICSLMCLSFIALKIGMGHHYAILAMGNNKILQLSTFCSYLLMIPFAWLCTRLGLGILSVGIAFLVFSTLLAAIKILIARRLVGLSIRKWLKTVFIPIAIASCSASFITILWQLILPPTLIRVLLSAFTFAIVFSLIFWAIALTKDERSLVISKLRNLSHKFFN